MTRREWQRAWPNHCRSCEANTDCANPCQSCLGAGYICPRCGTLTNDEGEDSIDPEDATIPCRRCGWVQDAGMGCPPSRKMIREEKEAIANERAAKIRRLRAELAELEGR